MDLISVGSQVLLFVTGRGSVIGAPVAPLVKITGNAETFRNLEGDVDFNAGRLLTGERSLDELGDELVALTIETARGTPTKPERLGHREYFVMYKHQDTPPLEIGCRA
jgi:altronate hydrolase